MSTKLIVVAVLLVVLSAVIAGGIVFVVRMNEVMPGIAATAQAQAIDEFVANQKLTQSAP